MPIDGAIGGSLEAIRNKVVTIEAVSSCCTFHLVAVRVNGIQTKCISCGRQTGGEFYMAKFFRPIKHDSIGSKLATELLESLVEERPEHVNEPEVV